MTGTIKSIVLYCGNATGDHPDYVEAARSLGRAIASSKCTLIYGGASGGLGGTVSASCLENGGMVTAIIPRKIGGGGKYVEESGALTIITTEDVNERIKKMHELADGFLALPGGTGTFEEIWQTASKLGSTKSLILLNVLNYYSPLRALVDSALSAGFIRTNASGNPVIVFVDV